MASVEPTKFTRLANGKKKAHRDSKWIARWRTPDGRSREKVFRVKTDAEQHLTSVEHSKLTGAYVDPRAGKITFETYAEQWRTSQIHRDGTAESVKGLLKLHVYPLIGERPIGAIRPSEIQALIRHLSQSLAPSSGRVAYQWVRSIFRAAVRDRIRSDSPCADVKFPTSATLQPVTQVLTVEQVTAAADSVDSRYRALVLAGAGLGLRPGELLGLPVDRVEFLRQQVHVDQQLVNRVPGQPLKTAASYRVVPLPKTVGDALAFHLKTYPAHPSGLIFTNSRGNPVSYDRFNDEWCKIRAKGIVPAWSTPHDLRHFYATTLLRSGLSVKVVQVRLGHASARVTLDIYCHIMPEEEDSTRSAVDSVLATSPRGDAVGDTAPETAQVLVGAGLSVVTEGTATKAG